MKRLLRILSIATVILSLLLGQTWSRASGVATERPRAPEHIEGLPPDVRRDVEGHAKNCGNRLAAGHYFSVSIEASGQRFRAQHFEDFARARRASVCRPEGCLHEVFADDGRRQWHVFTIYAREIELTNDGGIAGIEVFDDSGVRSFVWNGRRFVANGRSNSCPSLAGSRNPRYSAFHTGSRGCFTRRKYGSDAFKGMAHPSGQHAPSPGLCQCSKPRLAAPIKAVRSVLTTLQVAILCKPKNVVASRQFCRSRM